MRLVAGIDSSTQSVKVVIRDAQTGELIREARGSHPDGTEVDHILMERKLTLVTGGKLFKKLLKMQVGSATLKQFRLAVSSTV